MMMMMMMIAFDECVQNQAVHGRDGRISEDNSPRDGSRPVLPHVPPPAAVLPAGSEPR